MRRHLCCALTSGNHVVACDNVFGFFHYFILFFKERYNSQKKRRAREQNYKANKNLQLPSFFNYAVDVGQRN